MKPELEDKIYRGVLRSVIWGAERAEVLHTLEVNGIVGEEAEQFYRRARAERIQHIRSEAVRKAILGAGILLAALGVLSGFWYGLGAITRLVLVICLSVALWGLWWLVDGIVSALMASNKRGPIDES